MDNNYSRNRPTGSLAKQNDDTPGPAPVDPTNVGSGRDHPHIPATDFDPIAVGDKIAEHLAEADKAVTANREHSMAAGALLLDVAQHYPEHLEGMCERIGLGLSRRKELLMIACGRKTLERSRADNAKRQARFKARKKGKSLPSPPPNGPLPDPVTAKSGNDVDPEASADAMKTAHAAAEAKTEPDSELKPKSKPGKSWNNSKMALAQFKVAVDHWLEQMSADDTTEAIAYAKMIGEHHIAKIREIAA